MPIPQDPVWLPPASEASLAGRQMSQAVLHQDFLIFLSLMVNNMSGRINVYCTTEHSILWLAA